MKTLANVGLSDVQAVYSGPEGQLWELVMGQQIHVGGFASSMDLATKAKIAAGFKGVDLCCCNGAGMRFLTRFFNVGSMIGVDATPTVIELGKKRCAEEGLAGKIQFVQSDVCKTPLAGGGADFVWGEDAWCYVTDKQGLINEAARLVRKGGTIAFTDWLEGKPMTEAEAQRYMKFMKFPTVATLDDYKAMLTKAGCKVETAEDTGRFPHHVDMYIGMLTTQLTYDALKIIGFDVNLMNMLGGEMTFMQGLIHEGKVIQGLIVAKKE